MDKINYLTEEDKERIISNSLDTIGFGLLRGMVIGSFLYLIFRRKAYFFLATGYSTGSAYYNAQLFYNIYVKNKNI